VNPTLLKENNQESNIMRTALVEHPLVPSKSCSSRSCINKRKYDHCDSTTTSVTEIDSDTDFLNFFTDDLGESEISLLSSKNCTLPQHEKLNRHLSEKYENYPRKKAGLWTK